MSQQPPPPPPATLLADARKAWRAKAYAERHIARLGRYSGRSRAMKRDELAYHGQLNEANATLARILGPQKESGDE